MFEIKENSGTMFKNDKGGNEKRPDLNGTVKIEGTEYYISGWEGKTQKGDFKLGLKFTKKEKKEVKEEEPEKVDGIYDDDIDSIPF